MTDEKQNTVSIKRLFDGTAYAACVEDGRSTKEDIDFYRAGLALYLHRLDHGELSEMDLDEINRVKNSLKLSYKEAGKEEAFESDWEETLAKMYDPAQSIIIIATGQPWMSSEP